MATHRLFFGDLEIGTITDDSHDFPRLSGTYSIDLSPDESDLHRHICDYIAYSREAWRLATLENDTDGSRWDAYQEEHESKFLDLIECDQWHVVSGGKDQRILIPNFGIDDEVIWSWDLSDTGAHGEG